jgi:hypothetical protein
LQVVIIARELLCVPSAALAALTHHEIQHVIRASDAVLAPLTASQIVTEVERQRHVVDLRPALAHPIRQDELASLAATESARIEQSRAAAQAVAHGLRDAVQAAARAAEKRLLAAMQQIAGLLNGSIFLEDLLAAADGDDSLAGLTVCARGYTVRHPHSISAPVDELYADKPCGCCQALSL